MNDRPRSSFLGSPFSNESPTRNQKQFPRQPLYLQPNSPYLSPRGSRFCSPRSSSGSPDFIPLGVSSPVGRPRQSWSRGNHSHNSSFSSSSTPPSSNSSYGFSPYKRQGSRGNFRGRRSYNNYSNNGHNSSNISLYIDKDALENPWAELEEKLKLRETPTRSVPNTSEETENSTVLIDTDSDSLDTDNS